VKLVWAARDGKTSFREPVEHTFAPAPKKE
jgi:hypothetical protein